MFTSTFKNKIIFHFSFLCISIILAAVIFFPIFQSKEIIIPYFFTPFNICEKFPDIWHLIKFLYIIFFILAFSIYSHFIYSFIFSKKSKSNSLKEYNKIPKDSLYLKIGIDENNLPLYIPRSSLYQNILITGTIGSGKTSSAIYPFTKQLISYNCENQTEKIGMLILDVKGNYYKQVINYAKMFDREEDLNIIELNGSVKYNPLNKPNLKPTVLANRLKTILTLFSKNNSESYWLDKAEQVLAECIKLCRLYNDGYVTFIELHKLITDSNYYLEKIKFLKEKFISGKFTTSNVHDLLSSLEFFEKEFTQLDSRTSSILKSEITRITGCFISDYEVKKTFCPSKDEINFYGFEDLINSGKIVVLNMNISVYRNLSKIIAAYLKLDFQTDVMTRLSSSNLNQNRSVCFICDEYHEFVTDTDANFYSQSREAKCINIVATQSYTSLLNSIGNQYTVRVIVQSLINKLWFRTDDTFTIEDAQKQIGKEDKIKESKSISENSKETNYNYLTNTFSSNNSTISESINSYTQTDYIFDTNFFTQKLETFSCLSFLSTGNDIIPPQKLKLIPYFLQEKKSV